MVVHFESCNFGYCSEISEALVKINKVSTSCEGLQVFVDFLIFHPDHDGS